MKKFFFIALFISGSALANDTETQEYCKHKYEQVTMDLAYEEAGCKFSSKTKEHISQNLQNTYLNCSEVLADDDRYSIGKQSQALTQLMIKKFGKEKACLNNASLYPKQIYN